MTLFLRRCWWSVLLVWTSGRCMEASALAACRMYLHLLEAGLRGIWIQRRGDDRC